MYIIIIYTYACFCIIEGKLVSIKLCNVPFNYEGIFLVRGLSLITYTCNTGGGWGGVKSPIRFFCILHPIWGGEKVDILCENAYIISGRPLIINM